MRLRWEPLWWAWRRKGSPNGHLIGRFWDGPRGWLWCGPLTLEWGPRWVPLSERHGD